MERLKSAVKFIQGFVDNMGKKHMSAYAAQAAYFIILSLQNLHSSWFEKYKPM